jgi:hypothetical protein
MPKRSKSIEEVRKKISQTQETILTSWHESGHVIYALLRYMKVESVQVFQAKKSKRIDGFTYYIANDLNKVEDPDLLDKLVHAEIGLSYAGLAAEKCYFKYSSGSDRFPMVLNGASDDLKSATNLIIKYQLCPPGRKRYNYKQRIIREVLSELQEHWDAVQIVAHALFKHKRLSFEELQRLIIKKSKNREFWKEQFKVINKFYEIDDNLKELQLKTLLFDK